MANVFRKKAIDRLSTPEQLDKMIPIVRPSTWLVVVGFTILCVSVIIWAFTATIKESYSCDGLVVRGDKLDKSTTEIVCFIPVTDQVTIFENMEVSIILPSGNKIPGIVKAVNHTLESEESMQQYFEDTSFATYITNGAPSYTIICAPEEQETTTDLAENIFVEIAILTKTQKPIQYVFPI